jgi:hypothetical protein
MKQRFGFDLAWVDSYQFSSMRAQKKGCDLSGSESG